MRTLAVLLLALSGMLHAQQHQTSAPRVIHQIAPDYPADTPIPAVPPKVILNLMVSPNGKAYGISVKRSAGKAFDQQGIDAVKHWRFTPARHNGQAVFVLIDLEVAFPLPAATSHDSPLK
jgi:TonB family protein